MFEFTLKSLIKVIEFFENNWGDTGSSDTPELLLPSKLKALKLNSKD